MTQFPRGSCTRASVMGAAWVLTSLAFAGEIETNSVRMSNTPAWLSRPRVERVTDRIERTLEWPIRRITALWHFEAPEFEKFHGFGPTVLALAKKADNSVHLGPRVTDENFDAVFGHELVHVILYQKYKEAIPKWLEEGLASYLAGERRVNYVWLAAQPRVKVSALTHPFRGMVDAQQHYQLSTAVIEFIASRCSLADLLQLSVGKSLPNYLGTYCEIKDLDAEFGVYLEKKAKAREGAPAAPVKRTAAPAVVKPAKKPSVAKPSMTKPAKSLSKPSAARPAVMPAPRKTLELAPGGAKAPKPALTPSRKPIRKLQPAGTPE